MLKTHTHTPQCWSDIADVLNGVDLVGSLGGPGPEPDTHADTLIFNRRLLAGICPGGADVFGGVGSLAERQDPV